MKLSISHIAVLLFAVLLFSCGEEPSSDSSSESGTDELKTEQPTEKTKSQADKLAAEKIEHMRDSIDRAKTAISPFLEEGCCQEEGRKEETCCCESVYEKYKSMLAKEKSKAVEIGMTDPILANCRKLMPKKFDQLENPPSEEPDELDDLFN